MARKSLGLKLFAGVVSAIINANKPVKKKPASKTRANTSTTSQCPRCNYHFKGASCPYCAKSISILEQTKNWQHGEAKGTVFLPPIPEGYQIYKRMLFVAGITYRKEDASRFIRSYNQTLEFESEPNNPKDKFAIKLIGVTPSERYFVGYVPKEISAAIIKAGLLDTVFPRIDRTYHGSKDYVEIRFQIIGLKENKKKFDAFLNNRPADANQKRYLKYFCLPVPRGLTTEQAKKIINEHQGKLATENPSQLSEYDAYLHILEEFDDKDFRFSYEIKKTNLTVLNEALNQLKQEGKSYVELDIQDVVDRVIKLKPELENRWEL